jgi:hypothetical protein
MRADAVVAAAAFVAVGHPGCSGVVCLPELMRILMNKNKLGWTASWPICCKVGAGFERSIGFGVGSLMH